MNQTGNMQMYPAERLRVLLIRCRQKLEENGGAQRTQARILKILYFHGPMNQKTLQEKLEIQSGSMSEIAAKLEKKGLLRREKDPADQRRIRLTLTDAGRADVERFQADGSRHHTGRFDALSPQEQQLLGDLLERLLASWEEPHEG